MRALEGAQRFFLTGDIAAITAKDNGLHHTRPRTPENTTPTTFRQGCEGVLKPALQIYGEQNNGNE